LLVYLFFAITMSLAIPAKSAGIGSGNSGTTLANRSLCALIDALLAVAELGLA
jgi:hypothetical protein